MKLIEVPKLMCPICGTYLSLCHTSSLKDGNGVVGIFEHPKVTMSKQKEQDYDCENSQKIVKKFLSVVHEWEVE